MVTVYSAPNTRALRVIWLLEEIGVKAEIKSMPYPPRKHAPDYVAVNPTGLVPLLVDGEVRLSESMAICDYLAIKHGSPLVVRPNDPERPQFLQWLWYGESTLMTPLSRLNVVSQVERKGPEVDAIIAGARDHVASRAATFSSPGGSRWPTFQSATRFIWSACSTSTICSGRVRRPIANACGRGRPIGAPRLSPDRPRGQRPACRAPVQSPERGQAGR